jgi:hypothetical protein
LMRFLAVSRPAMSSHDTPPVASITCKNSSTQCRPGLSTIRLDAAACFQWDPCQMRQFGIVFAPGAVCNEGRHDIRCNGRSSCMGGSPDMAAMRLCHALYATLKGSPISIRCHTSVVAKPHTSAHTVLAQQHALTRCQPCM